MAKHPILFTLVTAALVAGLVYTGANQASEDHDTARELARSGDILPLAKILERAETDQPGRVVESELEREHGRYVYELEIVDESGVAHKLYYDASDGTKLKQKRDD